MNDELEKLIRNNIHTFADEYLELDECVAALTDYINKQIEEVLNRLEARLTEEASGIRQIKTDYAYGFTAANDQTNEAIEAERTKLKEAK